MTQQSLGLMIALQGRITAQQYEAILQDQLLPIIQTLFHNDAPVFQDDNVFTHTHKYKSGFSNSRMKSDAGFKGLQNLHI